VNDLIGSTLSHYRVTARLGAGGMGEVYRATDDNLDRPVALKLLPDNVSEDPERLARFEREAKLLATLSHPNVGSIYGLEKVEERHFLVLELVEGEDLAARIGRGPIPLEDALEIAFQIADGVAAAHERGIVHRDLKPGNVMLQPDGSVKVLDFGLAKATGPGEASGSAPALSQSPTMAYQSTMAGVLLGTAGYMSPEQAKGKAVALDAWSSRC
jgi:serine/threonine protein kinase